MHVQFFERELTKSLAARHDLALDVVEAPLELLVRHPQRGLRLDAELPRDVDQREQQVAEFLLRLGRRAAALATASRSSRISSSALSITSLGLHPVEAYLRRARAELVGAKQRRHRSRHAAQHGLLGSPASFVAFPAP